MLMRIPQKHRIAVVITLSIALFFGACERNPTEPSPLPPDPIAPTPPPAPPPGPIAPVGTPSKGVIWLADTVVVLPVPAGARELVPIDINDAGDVAGIVVGHDGSYREAFIWSAAYGLQRTAAANAGERGLIVTGFNEQGTIIGYEVAYSGGRVGAFAWNRISGLVPPAGEQFAPMDINELGTIVGYLGGRPIRWSSEAGIQELPRTTQECTVATAINDNDEILGWSGKDEDGWGCFPNAWVVWRSSGDPVEIMSCPKREYCDLDLGAFNERGEVAGTMNGFAIRVTTRGEPQIQTLGGASGAMASDINAAGDITVTYQDRPYIWTAAGELRALPLPGDSPRGWAKAINARGEVAGSIR